MTQIRSRNGKTGNSGPDQREKPEKATPGSRSAKVRLAPSKKDLLGLDLAIRDQALSVPVIADKKLQRPSLRWDDLIVPSEQIDANHLVSKHDHTRFELMPTFASGSFGRVRNIIKHDPVVKQSYVGKELITEEEVPRQTSKNIEGSFFKQIMSAGKEANEEAKKAGFLRAYNRLHKDDPKVNASAHTRQAQAKTLHIRRGESGKIRQTSDERINVSEEETIKEEVNIMLMIKSPLAPHAILETSKSKTLLLPVLHCDGFSLIDLAKSPKEKEAVAASFILSGAETIHELDQHGYVHRDIKPENFLVDRSGSLHLSDFGLATQISKTDSLSGTLFYLPPESLSHPEMRLYRLDARKSDLWSLGMSAVEALGLDNFVASMLEDVGKRDLSDLAFERTIRNFSKSYERAYHRMTKAYANEVLDVKKLGFGPDALFEKHFINLYKASPKLFASISVLVRPNPAMRPAADLIIEEVKEVMGDDLHKTVSHILAAPMPASDQSSK